MRSLSKKGKSDAELIRKMCYFLDRNGKCRNTTKQEYRKIDLSPQNIAGGIRYRKLDDRPFAMVKMTCGDCNQGLTIEEAVTSRFMGVPKWLDKDTVLVALGLRTEPRGKRKT